ncbi:sterol desaturase family protein [Alkalinema pantanalense CENA528]|uniref:sterol desaturase family protein n=1 Tax=Alkalinema pantanalense TaxID=1620705 RepID=UPI003D6E45FB
MLTRLAVDLGFLVAAFVLASLVEYWVHRLMHQPYKLGEKHRDHHRRNEGQGVIWEFRDYLLGTCVVMAIPYFWSWEIGLAWTIGGVAFAAFAAYAHQLQHENPRKCFWMPMPVHYVHHKYGMWNHNFGLAVDWWDRVFGTYKVVDWLDEKELQRPTVGFLELRWL